MVDRAELEWLLDSGIVAVRHSFAGFGGRVEEGSSIANLEVVEIDCCRGSQAACIDCSNLIEMGLIDGDLEVDFFARCGIGVLGCDEA